MKTFYPFSQNALKPLQIFVRKDASVNDAIGLALYQYVEEKREPLIPDKLARVWCWNLRIVEDDGEIDEDFPGELMIRLARIALYIILTLDVSFFSSRPESEDPEICV